MANFSSQIGKSLLEICGQTISQFTNSLKNIDKISDGIVEKSYNGEAGFIRRTLFFTKLAENIKICIIFAGETQ